SDSIELEDLPLAIRGEYVARLLPSIERKETMREWAARYARLVLQRCGGNKREASRVLGISYHKLGAYLKRSAGAGPGGDSWTDADAAQHEPDAACVVEA